MMARERYPLSILLHALTTNEKEDHAGRAMWMGEKVLMDYSALSEKSHRVLTCEDKF